MNAKSFIGDDEREFGPDPDEGRCQSCGAAEDWPCEMDCDCPSCQRARLRGLDIDPDGTALAIEACSRTLADEDV